MRKERKTSWLISDNIDWQLIDTNFTGTIQNNCGLVLKRKYKIAFEVSTANVTYNSNSCTLHVSIQCRCYRNGWRRKRSFARSTQYEHVRNSQQIGWSEFKSVINSTYET